MTLSTATIQPRSNPRFCRGFTLIEVLVSIAVVAILTAILIVGLRAAFNKAKGTEAEAHGRSYHQLHASWWADHSDSFVNVGQYDEGFRTRRELLNPSLVVYLETFDGRLMHIPYALQASYPAWKAVVERHAGERVGIDTPFGYGYAFFTDPELWRAGQEPWRQWPATHLYRFVRSSEAQFASSKGLLAKRAQTDRATGQAESITVVFVDGSTGVFPRESFLAQASGFLGGTPLDDPDPVLHTIDGVRGRDVAR